MDDALSTRRYTALSSRGYSVFKNEVDVNKIRSELTVTPYVTVGVGNSFKIYQESTNKIYVPKYYGLKNYGVPSVMRIPPGAPIDVKFVGDLRPEQIEPVEKCLAACRDLSKMGGIISVPCGAGKCFARDTPIMMFDGSIKYVQNVIDGDVLMGDDSTPRRVFSLARGKEMLYKIRNLRDGTSYIVNESHILSLKDKKHCVRDIKLTEYLKTSQDLYGYRMPLMMRRREHTQYLDRVFKKYGRDMDLPLFMIHRVEYVARALGYTTYRHGTKLSICQEELLFPISIEKLKVDDYYGFVIDGNHRFLLGDFTVVHNTTMALHITCSLSVKTMIVVHKEFLLQQWKERIHQFTPAARVGTLKASVIDVKDKDIVIASLQSLSMKTYEEYVFEGFGLCIFDEVHHAAAEVFSEALKKVNFRYSIGLSATPKRKDGLSKVFLWHLGDIVYQIKKRSDIVEVHMKTFLDETHEYTEEFTMFNGKLNVAKMINNICEFTPRTQFIVNEIVRIITEEPERKLLVLSDRRRHIDTMVAMLVERGMSAGTYYGGMKDADLKASESKQIIAGSYQFSSEGLDIAGLNTLVLASPKTDIVQIVGRILRDRPETRVCVPLIIDIVDNFSLFEKQANKRLTYYKSCSYVIL